jgi:hypothetical protein
MFRLSTYSGAFLSGANLWMPPDPVHHSE